MKPLRRPPIRLLAAAMLCCLPAIAEASGFDRNSVHERSVMLRGDPALSGQIRAIIFTPDEPKPPFPAVIFNPDAGDVISIGKGGDIPLRYSYLYFLSRGYAVIQPLSRDLIAHLGMPQGDTCDAVKIGQDNARDLAAIVGQVAKMPFVRADQIVMAGQDYGGWSTLAFATRSDTPVRAAIAFSPALRQRACMANPAASIAGAQTFGANNHLRTLWFYGEGSRVVPLEAWRAQISAFKNGGASLQAVDVGKIMPDAHLMDRNPFTFALWVPVLDDFLRKAGMPHTAFLGDYLPRSPPPPSNFADVTDAEAVPYITDETRKHYADFLKMRMPRVLVISPSGTMTMGSGGFDPLGLVGSTCSSSGARYCAPYAVDNTVVWHGPHRGDPAISALGPHGERMEHLSLTVTQGQTVRLGMTSFVSLGCKPLPSTPHSVQEPPQHGRITLRTSSEPVQFPSSDLHSVCNGTTLPVTHAFYTPTLGYSGTDHVTLEQDDEDGLPSQRTIITLAIH